MLGPIIIIVILCVIMPVSVMMSGAVAAGLLGWFVNKDVDKNYEGSELLETNR